ncbi:MAG TPA: hypothetical protein VFT99_06530 [Roseiflexaceae bacterium]|nr:hypothetical protein [Roseiflexaceae bacterium]
MTAGATSACDHFGRLASIPYLVALADANTTLRLGSILAIDAGNPVQLAHEVASVDVLSGGRMELRLGAGWLRAIIMRWVLRMAIEPHTLDDVNRVHAAIRAALGDEAFEKERAAGQRLSIEEALAQAHDNS